MLIKKKLFVSRGKDLVENHDNFQLQCFSTDLDEIFDGGEYWVKNDMFRPLSADLLRRLCWGSYSLIIPAASNIGERVFVFRWKFVCSDENSFVPVKILPFCWNFVRSVEEPNFPLQVFLALEF